MSEDRHDLLHVMRHENEGGTRTTAELLDEGEETFAGHRVETGAGFVQDEQVGSGHEGAGDEDALAFALGEHGPGAVLQRCGVDEPEQPASLPDVGGARAIPDVDGGVFAADHDFEGGFVLVEQLAQGGADQPDPATELRPIGFAEAFPEELDAAGARGEVAGQCGEEGRLSAADGSEEHPVFARADRPIPVGKNLCPAPMGGESGQAEDRDGVGSGARGRSARRHEEGSEREAEEGRRKKARLDEPVFGNFANKFLLAGRQSEEVASTLGNQP